MTRRRGVGNPAKRYQRTGLSGFGAKIANDDDDDDDDDDDESDVEDDG